MMEEKAAKKDNIKFETMTVPILDVKLNKYDFRYWEELIQTYGSLNVLMKVQRSNFDN